MEKHIFLFGEIGGWGINEADILKEIAQVKEDKAEQLIVQISSFMVMCIQAVPSTTLLNI